MNTTRYGFNKLIAVAAVTLLLAACSSGPKKPDGSESVRSKLAQLQSDSQLASRAPVALKDAELAVRAAEAPEKDKELSKHLVYIADRKIETARSIAQTRLAEDQRSTLSDQRQTARLDSRTREADNARLDAQDARRDANMARDEAEMARRDTAAAWSESDDLQKQIDELNAKETERGLVVTLGDLLFDTGKAELKGGASEHLGKLATFLNKHQGRGVIIEGHTDSVGSESLNMSLSQRRANSVKTYLVSQGVNARRLIANGLGENSPTASNDTVSGRQQNRRVEVIIENTVASNN
jgi:outer membrane protein OmpA-like peptidoglycan-associated protein